MRPKQHSTAQTCSTCGQTFVLSDDQVAWFVMRDLAVPRRCQRCREIRRAQAAQYGHRHGANPAVR